MARFGDLEAAVMDLMWSVRSPVRVRWVTDEINRDRHLAFNTVQTVMENLFRKGWLTRRKDGQAYWYAAVRTREDYVAGLLREALTAAPDPTGTLVRLVMEELRPAEAAQLRRALGKAAAEGEPAR